jgi:hypothetical protein
MAWSPATPVRPDRPEARSRQSIGTDKVSRVSRAALVAEVRDRLLGESFPRSTMLLIVSVCGGCAFLFSAASLSAGLESMAIRYLLSAAIGYGAFIVLVRAWIAYRRGTLDPGLDAVDALDSGAESTEIVHGGRGGGGSPGSSEGLEIQGSDRLADVPLDFDDLWPVIVAVLLTIGGLVAILYVVYLAPLLLAEVALDAALVSGVYRRLRRREDARHWVGGVLRRTSMPALALMCFATLLGFVLRVAVPDAQSIGDVLRALG